MLTMSENIDDFLSCMKAGAAGFILKNTSTDFLISAINKAVRGEKIISDSMTDKLMTHMTQQDTKDFSNRNIDLNVLSRREKEVLILIGDGMSNKIIASYLHISENTIKAHVQNILKKLQIRSRVQAAVLANNNIELLKKLI